MRTRFGLVCIACFAFLLLGCQNVFPMKRTISVSVTVPNPAWQIQIERVYLDNGRLHVVSRLFTDPSAEMVAQVISQATDSISIRAPDLPIQHHVIGKTWNWSEEPYNFVKNESSLDRIFVNLKLLFEREQ